MNTVLSNMKIQYENEPCGIDTYFPRFSWDIDISRESLIQTAYRIVVKGFIDELFWDSGVVESCENVNIVYGGKKLVPDNEYSVTLFVYFGEREEKLTSHFRTGLLDEKFTDAKWIKADDTEKSPLFKKVFFTGKRIAFATAYVAARGLYEFYVNGKRPDERVLAPAILSHYSHPLDCVCDAYDITDMLTLDNNVIGFMLGEGYSRATFNRYGWVYDGGIKLLAAVSITYEDGSYDLITTDDSFLWHKGPVLDSTLYHGETYDKNLEIPDWCDPYADTSDWKNAEISNETEGVLNIKTVPIYKKSITKCERFESREDEVSFCDFGKNGAGVIRIKVMGEPGAKIIMTHSESLNSDGTLNFFTNRGARNTDTYILKGHEVEIYEPHFTYHCFRYAEIKIEGVAQLISAEKVTYGFAGDIGNYFKTDNELINRMYENARRSMLSNLISYVADTASRDERTPCDMDSMAYEETAVYSFDMLKFYKHWNNQLVVEKGEGVINPQWGGDVITVAYILYKYYGDTEQITENYDVMKDRINGFVSTYKTRGFTWTYGDWCAPKEGSHNKFTNSFTFSEEVTLSVLYGILVMMTEIAEVLGKVADEEEYKTLAKYFRDEFYKKYYDSENHTVKGGEQSKVIPALFYGIIKEEDYDAVYESLKKRIKEVDNCKITTGIYGTKGLLRVLSRDGEGLSIFAKMLYSPEPYGYTNQIMEYDATTLFEQWHGIEGMCTMNHAMFGGIFADFYRTLAGIENLGDAFKKILIKPHFIAGVSEIHCGYNGIRGFIGVDVRKIGEKYYTDVVIPYGTSARVETPDGKVYEVGAGKYMFY